MDFGITFPSYIRAYHDAKMAEDCGFTHAWFYDSQMCVTAMSMLPWALAIFFIHDILKLSTSCNSRKTELPQ